MATETKEKNASKEVGKASANGAGVALTIGKEKPEESKAAKFKRLANMRLPKATKAIENVGNVANRNAYEYTPEQAATVVKMLKDAVASVESRFAEKDKASVPSVIF